MTKKLILSDGTRERELHLVDRIVVGRDPECDISHDDSLLSRRHAEFVTAGNEVTVRDLGSRNGVFVNGSRATARRLEPGDIVQIGPLRARFLVDAAPSSVSPEVLDVDRTAMFNKAAPVVRVALDDADADADAAVDDDATRLVPSHHSPAVLSSVPASVRLAVPPVDDDDDITMFKAGPPASDVRPVERPSDPVAPVRLPDPAAARSARVGARPTKNPLQTFVYVQLVSLVMLVLAAGAIGVAMWAPSAQESDIASAVAVVWLALPIVAALVGISVIGGVMNRRISTTLEAGRRART